MSEQKENELKIIIKKREQLFARLQRCFDCAKRIETNKPDPKDVKAFKLIFPSCEGTVSEIEEYDLRFNRLNLELKPDFEPQLTDTGEMMDFIFYIASSYDLVKVSESTKSQEPIGGKVESEPFVDSRFLLGKLQITPFSGNQDDWPVFSQLFESLIHKNKALSDLHKVSFLVSHLTGAALKMCSQIGPTGENYKVIKDLIWTRYGDPRAVSDRYIEKILNFPPLKVESKENLELFLDVYCASISALTRLNLEDLIGSVFLYQGLKVIDPMSRREFESYMRDKGTPTFADLALFAEKHLQTLRARDKSTISGEGKKHAKVAHALVVNSRSESVTTRCDYCGKSNHLIADCRLFLKLSPWERFKSIKSKRLCLKCLGSAHQSKECKVKTSCTKCDLGHHSLLHFEFSGKNEPKSSENPSASLCALGKVKVVETTVLLATAVVNVVDSQKRVHKLRLLLDSGSQSHFLTTKVCRRLGLTVKKGHASVLGIGGNSSGIVGKTFVKIRSRFDEGCEFDIEPLVIEKIVDKMPVVKVDMSRLSHLKHLKLADEEFASPREVDGIIGAELVPHLLTGTKIIGEIDQPVAMLSQLGYIVMGRAIVDSSTINSISLLSIGETENLRSLLEKFWKIEEVPSGVQLERTVDETACEQHFVSNVQRDQSGRYCVALPFKSDPLELGESFRMAERRFLNLERRLAQNPSLLKAYRDIINDYIAQNHLSLVPNPIKENGYFIPHHCVHKPQSVSTPVRIVFDASAKSSTGKSLNDVLHIGPKLQANLVQLLLNFRLFRVAVTADIRQMYRQIQVRQTDRKYLQILWRDSVDSPLLVYQHNAVVFGLASPPFLALRTVQKLVEDEGSKSPLAAQFVPRDTYMDDLATSLPTVEAASALYIDSRAMFAKGGFDLVKWSSNLASQIPSFSDEVKEFHVGDQLAILGLDWHPVVDEFQFKIDLTIKEGTKRNIASTVARIYDPLGFLSPVMLVAKGLIKTLWQEGRDWDQPPSERVSQQWKVFQEGLSQIPNIRIPRHVGVEENSVVSLVGFCDASEKGYGGAIYLIAESGANNRVVRLLCGKAKVAPSKTQSIPRLELLAAVLLAQLLKFAAETIRLRHQIHRISALSDSQVVLCWLKASPAKWQTFVANRVRQVQDVTVIDEWLHVPGVENPADCLSRGLFPNELIAHHSWWTGPKWLIEDRSQWPVRSMATLEGDPPEAKVVLHAIAESRIAQNSIIDLINRMSKYSRLLNTVVFILRFLRRLPIGPIIQTDDVNQAELVICKVVQTCVFEQDLLLLKSGRECSKRLKYLSPFVDEMGILRVGGRLSHANIGFDHRHPILLPKIHPLTNLIIDHFHQTNLHTGPHLLLSILRQKFWILSARQVVRQRYRSCNRCFRSRPRPTFPKMADLPACRVSESRAFVNTGVDYAGPIRVSLGRKRNPVISKAYLCLFVCLNTKAVHVELVSGLSTELFLDAFRRFTARRGSCKTIYSDNGTNFVGAKSELKALYEHFAQTDLSQKIIDNLKINWVFSPPSAPHFGGLWEANIKSVKTHLFKVIGEQLLTYEELNSVLVRIEAVLNSRPLCPLSDDPSEPVALTPAHFLMSSPVGCLPARDVSDVSLSRLGRFQLLDRMVQAFWNRWSKEYLHELQVRSKWTAKKEPLRPGTVVLVEEASKTPLQWPLGIVEEVFPGKDGVVRVVKVRLASKSCLVRPAVKIFRLPSQ